MAGENSRRSEETLRVESRARVIEQLGVTKALVCYDVMSNCAVEYTYALCNYLRCTLSLNQ